MRRAWGGVFGHPLLYGYREGDAGPRYLCILPGGAPAAEACVAGGTIPTFPGNNLEVRLGNALSADGSRLYFSTERPPNGTGRLYLREDPFAEAPECSGEGAPCSYALAAKPAQFWGASPSGATAIYSSEGKLSEYDASAKESTKIAAKLAGVAGISEDATDVYFISEEALTPPGEESANGEHAEAGKLNLYLHEAAGPGTRFIAALRPADLKNPYGDVASVEPWKRTTKVSPDGQTIAFMSSAPLTGYDNTDLNSGEADAEVYLYRASANGGKGRLLCVSCNPTGSRPLGANLIKFSNLAFWAAASLPRAENNLHEARVLTGGGDRLYFDSSDALVRGDANGVADVYQWEAAGTGGCEEEGTDYVDSAEGCIDLISSGRSPIGSEFAEATPSGDDVFFTTLSSLVPQDPGVNDLYDARANGGLPVPQGPAPSCEGEACQGPYEPPNDPTPASSSFEGAGNVHEAPARKKHHKKRAHKKHKSKARHRQPRAAR